MNDVGSTASIHLIKATSKQNSLQNGSTVFVRVLSKGQGGEYLVNFAGNKLNVFSQRELQVGTAFRATVALQDGKIFLTPQSSNDKSTVQKFSVSDSSALANLSGFLQEMGLKPDGISLRLIQFFQSSGFTFNAKLASKARSIGLQFPGKEADASEVALFLEQKGIHADVDTVMEVLALLYGDDFQGHYDGEEESNSEDSKKEKSQQAIAGAIEGDNEKIKNDEKESIPVLNAVYENVNVVLDKQKGFLTYINHTYSSSGHWILLPFEYDNDEQKINGTIRMLIDLNKKITEKMIISAFLGGKNYKIMVKCPQEGNSANQGRYAIQVCTDTQNSVQDSRRLCNMLKSCLPSDMICDISYSEDILNDGIFIPDSVISVVKLDA